MSAAQPRRVKPKAGERPPPSLFRDDPLVHCSPSRVMKLRSSVSDGSYVVQPELVADAIMTRLGFN